MRAFSAGGPRKRSYSLAEAGGFEPRTRYEASENAVSSHRGDFTGLSETLARGGTAAVATWRRERN
jgi:hypothetical protein